MTPPVIFTDVTGGVPAADLALAVAVYHKLYDHYPGHQWRVSADHKAGIATVQLLYLDKMGAFGKWGYVLKIDSLSGDPTLRAAVRAGGELLERFGLPRRGATPGVEKVAVAHGLDVSR